MDIVLRMNADSGPYFVYVLFSPSRNRFYIGQTKNLEKRLYEHNHHKYAGSYTGIACDWEVFYKLLCKSRSQAIRIELHIKKSRKRKYLFDLKKYPEIGEKLIVKYAE